MHKRAAEALQILRDIGMPRAQLNERTALALLAIAEIKPKTRWKDAGAPLMGITPIMDFVKNFYRKRYAPNSRETFRKQSVQPFRNAGVALYNPDNPGRPVNSPAVVYQISPEALSLVRAYGTTQWSKALTLYRKQSRGLADRYAAARDMKHIPLRVASGAEVKLSPGRHSELIRQIVEVFGAHYAPGGTLLYAGDTGDKWGYFDEKELAKLGVRLDSHGKMPDVVIHFRKRNWLLLCEAVTSSGPVDGKRHDELKELFSGSTVGLVFVTAFPDRAALSRYLSNIAWETEVWCAEAPTHLIHFNGARFLGPH